MELLTMSNRETDRLHVIKHAIDGKLTWHEAGMQLLLSGRQIGRLCAKVRAEGNAGIIHGLRGRPSNHQLEPGLIEEAMRLVKSRYSDFKATLANEKLREEHGIVVSTPVLRKAMIKEGLYFSKKRKPKHRNWRPRRTCAGMLVQLDGSEHDWFEGRGPRCVLLVYIDDATSRILYAEFIAVEDTVNLLKSTKGYLLLNGRPAAFYVDKDSIYRINRQTTIEEELRDSQPLTQFTRAMGELGIEVIAANSPQAKGRVERGFKTHQDRLVKELRLAGMNTMTEANKFLWDVYIPKHNKHFAVAPANPRNMHRPLLKTHRLDEILSIRTERVVGNDYTVRFQNRFFQIEGNQKVIIRPKSRVTVEIKLDGATNLKCRDVYLKFRELPERPYRPYYLAVKPYAPKYKAAKRKPCKAHPWRKWVAKPVPLPGPMSQIMQELAERAGECAATKKLST